MTPDARPIFQRHWEEAKQRLGLWKAGLTLRSFIEMNTKVSVKLSTDGRFRAHVGDTIGNRVRPLGSGCEGQRRGPANVSQEHGLDEPSHLRLSAGLLQIGAHDVQPDATARGVANVDFCRRRRCAIQEGTLALRRWSALAWPWKTARRMGVCEVLDGAVHNALRGPRRVDGACAGRSCC